MCDPGRQDTSRWNELYVVEQFTRIEPRSTVHIFAESTRIAVEGCDFSQSHVIN